jgi:hypothetical protein
VLAPYYWQQSGNAFHQHGPRGAPSARAPRNQTGARPGCFLCGAQAQPKGNLGLASGCAPGAPGARPGTRPGGLPGVRPRPAPVCPGAAPAASPGRGPVPGPVRSPAPPAVTAERPRSARGAAPVRAPAATRGSPQIRPECAPSAPQHRPGILSGPRPGLVLGRICLMFSGAPGTAPGSPR